MTQSAEPLVTYAEVGEALDKLAAALGVIVNGYGPPWAEAAPALADLAADDGMEGAPLLDGLLMVGVYLGHAKDHLRAAAAVVDQPDVIMACFTLARPVLGSMSRAAWLLEPNIDATERMRRGMNLQLRRLAELQNIASDRSTDLQKTLIAKQAPAVDRLERNAKRAKLHVTRRGRNKGGTFDAHYVGADMPKDMVLQRRLLDRGDAQPTSDLVFRVASTFVHGEFHIIDLMPRQIAPSTVAPGVGTVQLGVTMANLVAFLGAVVIGVDRVGLAAVRYAGLPDSVWRDLTQPVMARWFATLHLVNGEAFRNIASP